MLRRWAAPHHSRVEGRAGSGLRPMGFPRGSFLHVGEIERLDLSADGKVSMIGIVEGFPESGILLPDLNIPPGPWSPFDEDGNLRDLTAEGWWPIGTLESRS